MEKMSPAELSRAVAEYFEGSILTVQESKIIGAFQALLQADVLLQAKGEEDSTRRFLTGK